MPPYYLIHQPGKVASQTLEQVIKVLAPEASVERHHYLSDRRLDELSAMCRLPGVERDGHSGVAHQLDVARKIRADLDTRDPDSVWVISGFRDPLALAQSAFFQNLPVYCPWVNYRSTDLNGEVDRLIEFFSTQFERMRSGLAAATFQEGLLNRKLEGPEPWFDVEFNDFYGVDIYRQEIGVAPFVIFRNDRFKFCVYRSETLPTALPALLQHIGLPPVQAGHKANAGDDKEYSQLYAMFRERFKPSPEMIGYYYDGKFFPHFYGWLWAKLDQARRRSVSPTSHQASVRL